MDSKEASARQRVLDQWEARLDEQQAKVWTMTTDQLVAHRAEQARYRATLEILFAELKEDRL